MQHERQLDQRDADEHARQLVDHFLGPAHQDDGDEDAPYLKMAFQSEQQGCRIAEIQRA